MANWFHKLFYDDNDVVTTPMSRIVQEQVDIRNAMTPNERLYTMFSKDEFGNMSPEMVTTVDLAITGAIGGCIVGGVANSKNAHHVTWMQNNRATQFTEPLAAQLNSCSSGWMTIVFWILILDFVLYLEEWLVW